MSNLKQAHRTNWLFAAIDNFIELCQCDFPNIWFNSVQLIKSLPEADQLSRENLSSTLCHSQLRFFVTSETQLCQQKLHPSRQTPLIGCQIFPLLFTLPPPLGLQLPHWSLEWSQRTTIHYKKKLIWLIISTFLTTWPGWGLLA